MTFDLAWGESVAVREAFLSSVNGPIVFGQDDLYRLGYPPHEGDAALIELTRKVIKRQTGNDYQYVLMTNGATGGVTIALRSLAQSPQHPRYCILRKPPHFRLYPSMIKAAGLTLYYNDPATVYSSILSNGVYLVDSLSNPLGEFSNMERNDARNPIVWDAVYYGKVYSPGLHPQPQHDVLVGSYSKLTGLNGLRVGWIATNDPSGYQAMKKLVAAEYCGISAASTKLILQMVGGMGKAQWETFERVATYKLDCNRTAWSKLEKFFGGTPVGKYGMFYYAPIDGACSRLLEKSGVIWSKGSELGTNDDFGRFNIGQDCRLVLNAVNTILGNDKI